MVIESIREFNRTVPFLPYEIRMAGGERYVVPHPDFILVSPKGSYVIVTVAQERPHHLNAPRRSTAITGASLEIGPTGLLEDRMKSIRRKSPGCIAT